MKKWIYLGLLAVIALVIITYFSGGASSPRGLGDILDIGTKSVSEKTEILIFVHPTLGFSFDYPSSHTLSIVEDGFGESVLIQKDGKGMQLYVGEFEPNIKVDSALVARDLVGEKIESLLDIELPKAKIPAVSFASESTSAGKVWDVWFSHSGYLYQVTCEEGEEELLKMFVESFSF